MSMPFRCVLDFETRSELDITNTSAYNYAGHPSTKFMCMGFVFDDEPEAHLWWPPWVSEIVGKEPDPQPFQRLMGYLHNGGTLEAHNAEFEICMWATRGIANGFPEMPAERWICTAARARAMGLPGALGKVGAALGLATQKDDEGNRVMLQLCKPKLPSKKNPSRWYDDAKRFLRMMLYCMVDVLSQRELGNRLVPLSPYERQVWLLDREINRRGVPVDLHLCAGALKVAETAKAKLNARFKTLTGIDRATLRIQTVKWIEAQWTAAHQGRQTFSWSVPINMQAETLRDWLVDEKHLAPPNIVEALQIYGLANKRAMDKFVAFMKYTQPDGRARGLLIYHGASTGRWTSGGVQIHNIKRGNLKKDMAEFACSIVVSGRYDWLRMFFEKPYDILGSCARGAIMARPGCRLVWSDFASIELCVLFWFADELDGLALIRSGERIYSHMAATIYGKPVSSIVVGELEDWVGKQTVLGAGYQMGWERFIRQCKKYGVAVADKLAKRSIEAFRTRFSKVPALWRELNQAALIAVQHPGQAPCVKGIATFQMVSPEWLTIRLPSGRLLWFYQPRVAPKKSKWGTTKLQLSYMGWNTDRHRLEREWTYGGKICENIVQAIARDIMVHAIILTTHAGWSIITHTHDEIVCEEPENGRGPANLAALMSQAPQWAAGCPVAAEGKEGTRYRK